MDVRVFLSPYRAVAPTEIGAAFDPGEHLAMSETFLIVTTGVGTTGIHGVEARDAAKHHKTVHNTAPVTKNHPSQNVSNDEIEILSYRAVCLEVLSPDEQQSPLPD